MTSRAPADTSADMTPPSADEIAEDVSDDLLQEWAATDFSVGREGWANSFPAAQVARELIRLRAREREMKTLEGWTRALMARQDFWRPLRLGENLQAIVPGEYDSVMDALGLDVDGKPLPPPPPAGSEG